MPTPYSEVDNMFLGDIEDNTLLVFDPDDKDEILDGLRRKAVTQFKSCKKIYLIGMMSRNNSILI